MKIVVHYDDGKQLLVIHHPEDIAPSQIQEKIVRALRSGMKRRESEEQKQEGKDEDL